MCIVTWSAQALEVSYIPKQRDRAVMLFYMIDYLRRTVPVFFETVLTEWMLTEYVESQLLPSLGVVEVL